jgi:hypothetical protein
VTHLGVNDIVEVTMTLHIHAPLLLRGVFLQNILSVHRVFGFLRNCFDASSEIPQADGVLEMMGQLFLHFNLVLVVVLFGSWVHFFDVVGIFHTVPGVC